MLSAKELMLLSCGVGGDSWESLGLQEIQRVHPKGNKSWIFVGRTELKLNLRYFGHLMQRMTHLKRPWCWEWLKEGEGDNRGWDGWMASLTQWTWVWVSSGSCWWTGKPGMLQFMGLQRVGHDWVTELRMNIRKNRKFINIWKFRNLLLSNQWVKRGNQK